MPRAAAWGKSPRVVCAGAPVRLGEQRPRAMLRSVNDPGDPRSAARLAQAIVSDLVLYHEDTLVAGLQSGRPFAGAEPALQEGLALLQKRFGPGPEVRSVFVSALVETTTALAERRGLAAGDLPVAALAALAAVAAPPAALAEAPAHLHASPAGAPSPGAPPPPAGPEVRRAIELGAPPRQLGLAGQLQAWLGHDLCLVACGVFLFSCVFVWVFVVNSELMTALELRGELGTATGTVTSVERTNSSENKVSIYAVTYDYDVDDRKLSDTSYQRGKPALTVGHPVTVEYSPSRPERSRIQGMRARAFGGGAGSFVPAFPLAAAVVWFVGVLRGRNRARLMRDGKLTWGRLVEQHVARRARGGRAQSMRLVFEYTDPDDASHLFRTVPQRRRGTVTVGAAEVRRVSDEPEEPMLALPGAPDGPVLMLDALPRGFAVESGQLRVRPLAVLTTVLVCSLALTALATLAWVVGDAAGFWG